MTNQFPITPPPKLVGDWLTEAADLHLLTPANLDYLATRAAQWGADQELEACCEWVGHWCGRWPDGTRPEGELRAARRPKPPSLKKQALNDLDTIQTHDSFGFQIIDLSNIRRAIEALPND
jgi:hypothetical protein